jgi:hypothetical protein
VIIQFIEKYAALQIVILAGYERTMMDCFLRTNEGINRRFPHKFILQPYTALELARIIIKKLKDAVKLNNEPKFEHDLESLIKEAIKNHSLKKLLQPFQPRPRMRREFVKFMKMTVPKEKPVDGTDPSNMFFVYQAADMETLASDIMSSFLNSKYTFADDKGRSVSRSRSSKRTRRNKKQTSARAKVVAKMTMWRLLMILTIISSRRFSKRSVNNVRTFFNRSTQTLFVLIIHSSPRRRRSSRKIFPKWYPRLVKPNHPPRCFF